MENTFIQPRVYQPEVVRKVQEVLQTEDRALFVMASGLGKSIVSALIVKEWLRNGKRGLFLCHEKYILEQVEEDYRNVIGNDIIYKTFYGSEAEGSKDWTADNGDMLFASFQALNNWHEKWYIAFDQDHFDFMIVDESHHGQAPSYKEVIDYFLCKKIGMTATPDRMDMKDIREIFGPEVYTITLEEGIAYGWLADVEYHILSDGINNRKLKKICKDVLEKGKRVSVKQLNETIFISERDKAESLIIAEYAKIKEYAGERKTLLFCERTTHADNLITHFEKSGVMHSKKSWKENEAVFQAFKHGELQYVASVNKFNEGKHVPGVEVIAFLRATDSLTIFFQQLGRALAKIEGKVKVIILDFVSNIERLVMVRDLMDRVKELAESAGRVKLPLDTNPFYVTGEGFEFVFSDELVDIMIVIEALREGFYSTWQEASDAAIMVGIKSSTEYKQLYKKDLRLPANPHFIYSDFPGWNIFLNTERNKPRFKENCYLTWEEASVAAKLLKIESSIQYKKKYIVDPLLPSQPSKVYVNFPGWVVFLSKADGDKFFYSTWEEASRAAINLGAESQRHYKRLYKKDKALPASPEKFYDDFPNWVKFLGNQEKKLYLVWEEASRAAINLGFKSSQEYVKKYKNDSRLPSSPQIQYKNFPGWQKFLGKK